MEVEAKSDENKNDYISIYFMMIGFCDSGIYLTSVSLCRVGALIDIRKHFDVMETKTELLNQCHNPESKRTKLLILGSHVQ